MPKAMAETTEPQTKPKSRKWGAVLLLFWPAALVVTGYLAWNRWGAQRLMRQFGQLRIEQIRIPPAPSYIRSDVLSRVFQDAGLDHISLLDQQSTAHIARAFETNPWVKKVDWVRKLPDGNVEVHLTYRRPVAVVPVSASRHPEVQGPARFAVDDEAVLLPSEEFDPVETDHYLHLLVKDVYPASGIGSTFGDERVLLGARLAGVLADQRANLKLVAIEVVENGSTPPLLVLIRSDRSRVVWGSPPGAELAGEVPAIVKLQRLLASPMIPDLDLRSAMLSPERPTQR